MSPPSDFIHPAGVLNARQITSLICEDVLRDGPKEIRPDASAVDLRLGGRCWVTDASVKQVGGQGDSVEAVLEEHGAKPLSIAAGGLVVEPDRVYVFELRERVDLRETPWLRVRATGKSSIGRLDVLTRLMVDGSPSYDEIPPEYAGALYLEVIPSTFRFRFRPGDSLAQIRFFSGRSDDCRIRDTADRRLLYVQEDGEYRFAFEEQMRGKLTVDLEPDTSCGSPTFRAIRVGDEVDWAIRKKPGDERIDPGEFFEPVQVDDPKRGLRLEKNAFYILRSRERLCLPRDISVTGYAYTESLGELRIHYAGFAHPYFGAVRGDERKGTPLIFEARAHTVDVILRHGEVLASVLFFGMSEPASKPEPDDYSEQELKLSKVFRDTPEAGWTLRDQRGSE